MHALPDISWKSSGTVMIGILVLRSHVDPGAGVQCPTLVVGAE